MSTDTKPCPECGETILAVAKKCKHCGSTLEVRAASSDAQQPTAPMQSVGHAGPVTSDAEFVMLVKSKQKSGVIAALLNLFLPGAGYAYCGRWVLGIFAFIIVVAVFVASFGLAAGGLILVLIIDGFLCASRHNNKLVERMILERQPLARRL